MSVDINPSTLFAASLRMSTPISFAAFGGMVSERVGVMNIGLEGIMIFGTFVSAYVSYVTGNPWLALLATVIAGAILGLLHAFLCLSLRGIQIVSGFGINILAFGMAPLMSAIIWGSRGSSELVTGLPSLSSLGLRDIPVLTYVESPLFLVMISIAIVLHILLYKTKIGLRIRAVGAHPKAAATAGINVRFIQYVCVMLSGVLASLGGAYLVLSVAYHYSTGMTGGRGFMGLVAMILGKWKPFYILGASILLGFGDALQISLQGTGVPVQIIQTIPYLLTIAVLIGIMGRIIPPTSYKPHVNE